MDVPIKHWLLDVPVNISKLKTMSSRDNNFFIYQRTSTYKFIIWIGFFSGHNLSNPWKLPRKSWFSTNNSWFWIWILGFSTEFWLFNLFLRLWYFKNCLRIYDLKPRPILDPNYFGQNDDMSEIYITTQILKPFYFFLCHRISPEIIQLAKIKFWKQQFLIEHILYVSCWKSMRIWWDKMKNEWKIPDKLHLKLRKIKKKSCKNFKNWKKFCLPSSSETF